MKKKQEVVDPLKSEGVAFDHQIQERVLHGHVPDFRETKRNEWFYNNVWRDPYFIRISLLANFEYFLGHLSPKSKLLEVGCGPGHFSLEFARNGHYVTGIDLSPDCVSIAKQVASKNKHKEQFGSLEYRCNDFLDEEFTPHSYDAVLFYGSLSHFSDLDSVLNKTQNLLKNNGRILIWDTSVDQYTESDAAIVYLIKTLLSFTGHYYTTEGIAANEDQLEKQISIDLRKLKYIDENENKVQSPNDNSQTLNSIIEGCNKRFNKIDFRWESSFYRNIIGGVRFSDREKELAIVSFIKLFESYMIKKGQINPAFFYFIGERKS